MPTTNEKLQKKQPEETGQNIKYGIDEMRKDPQKIHRWLTQREETPEIAPTDNAAQSWEKPKAKIQQALIQTYPIRRKKKEQQEPEWAKQAKQWSTEEEWGKFQNRLKQRNQLQEKITQLDNKGKKHNNK